MEFEEVKALKDDYPYIMKKNRWEDMGNQINIFDMSVRHIEAAINYLEKNVKPAYSYNQRTDGEKEVARIIDLKIAEFKKYL